MASTSPHTVRRLLNDRADGKLILDIPWTGKGHNGGGPRPVLEPENTNKLVDQWKRGESHGRDMITKAINQVTNSTIRRSGGVPFHQSRTVCKAIITNIRARIANHPDVSLASKVTKKIDTRIVAEASLWRIACLIDMVMSTHIISVLDESLDICNELKQLPFETKLLMDAVSEAHGTPMFPVKPHNIYTYPR